MAEVTLSSQNRIVIPAEARKALGLQAGDKLTITVHGDELLVMRTPKSYRRAIRGVAKGVYPADYLQKERGSWG
jgi:AbrB family looped-hinge helix DNA binding protein